MEVYFDRTVQKGPLELKWLPGERAPEERLNQTRATFCFYKDSFLEDVFNQRLTKKE